MSTRWATIMLCALALSAALLGSVGAAVAGTASGASTATPPLTLASQTPWVTPQQPWFDVAFAVSASAGPAADLRVNLTFYGRLDNASQLQQAVGGTPQTGVLLRLPDVAVATSAAAGPTGSALGATACVTVLPDARASAPAGGPAACAGGHTLVLGCTAGRGTCDDVYPVTATLVHQGSTTPLARLTTFLTYQEPEAVAGGGPGGPLRVGIVVPVGPGGSGTVAGALAGEHDVAATLAVDPATVAALERAHTRAGVRALAQLAALPSAQVLAQPFVPVDVASLAEARITNEIGAQVTRGDEILRGAGLKPAPGPWVDTVSTFSQADAGDLATGLQVAGAHQLVLSDQDVATGGLNNYTFAQPFTLDLGHGASVPALEANSTLSARFVAQPADPVLGAEQLLASLSFVHFENEYLGNARGVVLVPPSRWQPSGRFLQTLLRGLSGNPALRAVTLDQLFAQVPAGGGPGDREPTVRHLQAGPARPGIARGAADRIALDRQRLASFDAAVCTGTRCPAELTALNDGLLSTEARDLSRAGRTEALNAYARSFEQATGQITLATEQTVTFTARQAAIPVTVRSDAPYPIHVVVTLASDKFTFPNGNTRQLTLNRPTTSVRVTAEARTSGDRLPIDVTLHTPDGQLLIARTVLTVHSTAISFAGVALTALAGAVLLAWWVRTWRKSRRQRPRRAH